MEIYKELYKMLSQEKSFAADGRQEYTIACRNCGKLPANGGSDNKAKEGGELLRKE